MNQHKFLILILLSCLSISGISQTISLQELINNKQFAEVLLYAEQLTPADSADLHTMSAVAQAYEGVLKHRNAYACYLHCLTLDTTNINTLNALARAATNLGKATDAKGYFQKVLERDSTDFYANYQLGRLYFQLGNFSEAAMKYEYLLERDEQNPTLLRNVGDCYMASGLIQAALGAYFLGFEYNKENVGLASTLINTILVVGGELLPDALSTCDTALYYNPGNHLLRQNKGMALYMNKKYAEADTLYTDLMLEGDSSYLTLKYGGSARYYAGQYFNAIEPLEKAYKIDTASVEVCLLLGSALGKTYDRKQAYVFLDQAEKNMQPKDLLVNQLYLFRAETYQKDGRRNEASRLYYELWKKSGKMSVLTTLCSLYNPFDLSQEKDENAKQRGLFINVLYIKEFLKTGEDTKNMFYKRNLLETHLKDMFFRGVKEDTMIAPDGKKSKITADEIRELANKLPEVPEKVKQDLETSRKAIEESRKKREKQ